KIFVKYGAKGSAPRLARRALDVPLDVPRKSDGRHRQKTLNQPRGTRKAQNAQHLRRSSSLTFFQNRRPLRMRGGPLFRKVAGFYLVLLFPAEAWSRQIYNDPYVALLDLNETDGSRNELKSLRSDIEEQRDNRIDACRKEERRLEQQLETARL